MHGSGGCHKPLAPMSWTKRFNWVFAVGILKIALADGSVAPVARYEADTVHLIVPFPGFERALTLEKDNTRVRLLRIE